MGKESSETRKARTKYENKLLDLEVVMKTRGKFSPKACFLSETTGTHRYVSIRAINFAAKFFVFYSEDGTKCIRMFKDTDWIELSPGMRVKPR